MKTEYRQWIAGRLVEIRTAAKLTQTSLANLLKIKPGTYATYEQRSAQPSLFLIKQICKICGITIDKFMEGSPEEEPTTQL